MRTTCLDSSPFHCIAIPHHTVANLTICSLAIQHHSALARSPRAARRRATREPFVISNGVRNPGPEETEQTLPVGRKLLGSCCTRYERRRTGPHQYFLHATGDSPQSSSRTAAHRNIQNNSRSLFSGLLKNLTWKAPSPPSIYQGFWPILREIQ